MPAACACVAVDILSLLVLQRPSRSDLDVYPERRPPILLRAGCRRWRDACPYPFWCASASRTGPAADLPGGTNVATMTVMARLVAIVARRSGGG